MDNGPTPAQPNLSFRPHPLVRNRHVQTIFSSLYRRQNMRVQQTAREMIIDAGDGVRLQGFYSPQPAGRAKGLVLLLHGWLGHAGSIYNTRVGDYLYQHGYAIFRLNLRDHGGTHRLNPGIFRGDLLAETCGAAQRSAQLESRHPFHIIGFSLGGSFALRLAWRQTQTPIPNLTHTIAICPVMDPLRVTLALDTGPPIYLAYFRRRWRQTYREKMAAFPELYDFSEVLKARTCLAMTDAFVRHTPYPTATAYFQSYTITPAMLSALRTPATIIGAADDPVVPVADFEAFQRASSQLQLHIQPYGGHVGFIDILPFRLWAAEAALQILENLA